MLKEHEGILYTICSLYTNSREDYEDLYQEVAYQLWKALPGFSGKSKISTWMYKVALFTSFTHIRKKPKAAFLNFDEQSLESAEPVKQDKWIQLEKALKQLNDPDRAVMLLYLEGKSYKEMAEILDITESNVGVRINRIKSKLKRMIDF